MKHAKRFFLAHCVSVCAFALMPTQALRAQSDKDKYQKLSWPDLEPDDWDPLKALRDANIDPRKILEGATDESVAMRKMREIWDAAPTRQDLIGKQVRLPGYALPLEVGKRGVREFLLVPYFGACIHSPPPPANQIVMVKLAKPAEIKTMEAVWVMGKMGIKRQSTDWGLSAYTIAADGYEAYKEKRNR